jgi:hypothetical protein
MADKSSPSLSLGQLLAFGAPGFIAFKAVSYYSSTAAAWINSSLEKEQGVGVFLFVALASLALGVIVSGVRSLMIDRFLCDWIVPKRLRLKRPVLDMSKLANADTRDGYEALNENYFRYYLFYANTVVAFIAVVTARAFSPAVRQSLPTYPIAIVLVIVLLISARDSLQRFYSAAEKLLQ